MKTLPISEYVPLVRTYFADDVAWDALRRQIETPNTDGFRAIVSIVDQTEFADIEPALLQYPSTSATLFDLIILADETALTDTQFPLLCIEISSGELLRVIASELWSIENNLTIGNMDFKEFVQSADAKGVFRGFG